MGSSSHRKSGSSARSTGRKRVVIGAQETVRVRYNKDRPDVQSERRSTSNRVRRPAREDGPGPGVRVANVKRDERERRQRAMGRRRLLVGAAIVCAVAALVWGLGALARAPIFSVTQVVVRGNSHLSAADIIEQAAIPADATLLRIPKSQIERNLAAQPWIGSAHLLRRFPHTVELVIVERSPVAMVDTGGTSIWLVDGQGVWIAKRTAENSASVPGIRDVEGLAPKGGVQSPSTELLNALAVVQGLSPELRAKVRTISAPTIDRTALILARGVQVFIGSAEEIAKKDKVALMILAQNKNVVYVNVRVVNRPTWRGLDSGN
jgi:cell division protein FtsQ